MTSHAETFPASAGTARSNLAARIPAAFRRLLQNLAERERRYRSYGGLLHMTETQLRDIGLTRSDVHSLLRGREPEDLRDRVRYRD